MLQGLYYITQSELKADTVEIFPYQTKMPCIYPKEAVTNTALYLVEALANPAPETPFAPIGATKLQALRQVAEIFKWKKDPNKLLRNKAPSPNMEATTAH